MCSGAGLRTCRRRRLARRRRGSTGSVCATTRRRLRGPGGRRRMSWVGSWGRRRGWTAKCRSWSCGIRGLLGGRCGLGRPGRVSASYHESLVVSSEMSNCIYYLLIDIYNNIVASVRHGDDVSSSWSCSLVELCGQIAVDVARRVCAGIIRSRRRQGPACDWPIHRAAHS
jgi:hypothetical protein